MHLLLVGGVIVMHVAGYPNISVIQISGSFGLLYKGGRGETTIEEFQGANSVYYTHTVKVPRGGAADFKGGGQKPPPPQKPGK